MYKVVYLNENLVRNAGLGSAIAQSLYTAKMCHSLEEARNVRIVSGDVVVDMNNRPVSDPAWLWEWEKRLERESYAWRFCYGGTP